MSPKVKSLIKFIQQKGGAARFSAILKAGFHSDSIAMLVESGEVEKIGKGLYQLISSFPSSHPDLITASLQAPNGIICLISALSFHEATVEIPKYVNIAILRGTRANKIEYPPVRYYMFSSKAWSAGIDTHEIDGRKIKVYNLAKTVVDCFKFRNKIGIDVARAALKTAIIDKKISPNDIMHFAKICRVNSIIQPILEAML
ncbi:MAG: type IV toxin-antitoxin system AbiEi family antitoxin domain-containing protein [Endomicrobiales bacterium]|nr:type IV toxin-antitoxin system AbiEi family antitoxin domain-containing protein [Endomicrobiales bacterium]